MALTTPPDISSSSASAAFTVSLHPSPQVPHPFARHVSKIIDLILTGIVISHDNQQADEFDRILLNSVYSNCYRGHAESLGGIVLSISANNKKISMVDLCAVALLLLLPDDDVMYMEFKNCHLYFEVVILILIIVKMIYYLEKCFDLMSRCIPVSSYVFTGFDSNLTDMYIDDNGFQCLPDSVIQTTQPGYKGRPTGNDELPIVGDTFIKMDDVHNWTQTHGATPTKLYWLFHEDLTIISAILDSTKCCCLL